MNEVAHVYHEYHVARIFPKSRISQNTGISKQHSRDYHIEYSMIVLSQNTQLGLAEYFYNDSIDLHRENSRVVDWRCLLAVRL